MGSAECKDRGIVGATRWAARMLPFLPFRLAQYALLCYNSILGKESNAHELLVLG